MRVQWKVHRRNVIIIVARFAYVTSGGEEEERGGSVGTFEWEEGGVTIFSTEGRNKVGKGEVVMTRG